MVQIEMNAMTAVALNLPEIAKQLKIANELKALELKLKYPGNENIVDSIVDK